VHLPRRRGRRRHAAAVRRARARQSTRDGRAPRAAAVATRRARRAQSAGRSPSLPCAARPARGWRWRDLSETAARRHRCRSAHACAPRRTRGRAVRRSWTTAGCSR